MIFLLLSKYISMVLELNFFVTIAITIFSIHILFYLGLLIADRRKSKDNNQSPKK